MAQVDRLKSRDEVLAAEADLPLRVADVSARLKAAYQQQGVVVSEETIAQGVELYFSQRLVFRAPHPTLGTRMAGLWINRARIAKGLAIAGATATVIALGVYFTIIVPRREAQQRVTVAAQNRVQEVVSGLRAAEQLEATVFGDVGSGLAAAERAAAYPELTKAVSVARSKLTLGHESFTESVNRAHLALTDFVPANRISYATASAATTHADQAASFVATGGRTIHEVSTLTEQLASLQAERASMESAWKRLGTVALNPALKAAAEQTYARGLAVVTAFGPAADVRAATRKLHELADTQSALLALPEKIKAAAAEAQAISREAAATALITATEREALAAVETGNTAAAEKKLAALTDLTAELNQSYTLRIVNRPGEYTRLWRYSHSNKGSKNFYIAVEAIAPDGTPVKIRVRSEEDGGTSVVSKWAERVDSATYDQVGRDKQDDGIVQNNIFAQKEKGHLSPAYLMGDKTRGGDVTAGRIYRW